MAPIHRQVNSHWKWITYTQFLVEVDAESIQAETMSITLPIGVQLNLKIKFEVMLKYCEGYHRNGHKKCECRKAITEITKRQAPNCLAAEFHASR